MFFIKLSAAFYDENDDVIELTKQNFDKVVIGSDNVWMVQFYATWCKYLNLEYLVLDVNEFSGDASKEMSDEFKKVAAILKGVVKVGAIDADKHRIIAKRLEITQVPSVMIFSGEFSYPYFEERSGTALAEAALSEVFNKVKHQLSVANANSKTQQEN